MLLQLKSLRRLASSKSTLKNLFVACLTLNNSVIPEMGNIVGPWTSEPGTTTRTNSSSLLSINKINPTITESAVVENISKQRHNQHKELNLPRTTKPSTMTIVHSSISNIYSSSNNCRWRRREERMTTQRSSATIQERKWDLLWLVMRVKWVKPLRRGRAR
jgi:hypothetical protein